MRERETVTDWQSARIVAMLAAVNNKQRRYDPFKYMARGAELRRRARSEAAAQRRPMTGDEVLGRIRQLGFPVIDKRAAKGV